MPSLGSSETHRAGFDLESLARALGDAEPGFVVWKGGRELDAQGDLDAAAPEAGWADLEAAFDAWARERGVTAAVTCTHAVGTLILVACGGSAGERLLQVDLTAAKLVHGAPVWSARTLAELAEDRDAVRVLPPGAEGLARRLADPRDTRGKELVAADPEGARALARRLGARGRLAARSDRAGRVALTVVLLLRPFSTLRTLLGALRTDRARRRCPVIDALRRGRRLPSPLEDWLAVVERDHEVRRA